MQRHCRIARQVPRLLNVCLGRNTYCHHGEFDDPIEKSWAKEIEISEERDEILEIQHGAHKEDMMKHATGRVMKLASERAVVVFTLSSCCMCHAVRSLMSDLGANAMVLELDNDPMGKEMERALLNMLGVGGPAVPAVFIGGRLVGGVNIVMSLYLSGKLVPMLRSVRSVGF